MSRFCIDETTRVRILSQKPSYTLSPEAAAQRSVQLELRQTRMFEPTDCSLFLSRQCCGTEPGAFEVSGAWGSGRQKAWPHMTHMTPSKKTKDRGISFLSSLWLLPGSAFGRANKNKSPNRLHGFSAGLHGRDRGDLILVILCGPENHGSEPHNSKPQWTYTQIACKQEN